MIIKWESNTISFLQYLINTVIFKYVILSLELAKLSKIN